MFIKTVKACGSHCKICKKDIMAGDDYYFNKLHFDDVCVFCFDKIAKISNDMNALYGSYIHTASSLYDLIKKLRNESPIKYGGK